MYAWRDRRVSTMVAQYVPRRQILSCFNKTRAKNRVPHCHEKGTREDMYSDSFPKSTELPDQTF